MLRVRLLGSFEVEGVPHADLGSRKARTLLKALALAPGRPVPTDTLVELLWRDDRPPADPAGQVTVLVSRLRRALGADRLPRLDRGYALAADWVDVVEVEELVGEAAARLAAGALPAARAAAGAALRLARGPLAADEEGEWFDLHRASVDRLLARLRLVAAEAASAAGDVGEVVALTEAVLDHDPYDEVALRLLMRAHAAAGRPASALAAYARVRARLGEDLGVDPTPETEELHTTILLADQPGGPAAGRTPAVAVAAAEPAGRLVGRDAELAELDRALDAVRAAGASVVVVEGEAGIGKTALVAHWAARLRDRGSATVLWGRCDELDRALPLQPVLDAVGDALRAADRGDVLGPEAAVLDGLLDPHSARARAGEATTAAADAEAGRLLLWNALVAVLERLGGGRPAVLVVDDLHLAGERTVEWLRFAARRGSRLLVVATARPGGPSLPGASVLPLRPLDVAAAGELVGAERAEALHARAGGHPLFLLELAAVEGDELPATVLDAVAARVHALGEAAATVRTAAVLGPVVDLDLLTAVLPARPVELLDHLEAAAGARLLVEHGASFAFAHDLVRDALVAGTTASRRALVHREAARALATRADRDPLEVAWHARLGGDLGLAAVHLVDGARLAQDRYDLEQAERHLAEAVQLADGAGPRMALARLRLSQWRIEEATEEVERAMAMGAGVDCLELAGWVAYYRRDYGAALRYAEEGGRLAADPGLRSSCLALAGRVRHARGELAEADDLLLAATDAAPAGVRGLVQVWLGALRVHQGRPADGIELVQRARVDPSGIPHPFAPLHMRFTHVYALGLLGRPAEALAALHEFEQEVDRPGDPHHRFRAVLANLHGWMLRGLGSPAEADERNALAAAEPATGGGAEPHYVGLLDLADGRLLAGDADGAARFVDAAAGVHAWEGTMAWRQRHRHDVLRARLALATGRPGEAAELAAAAAAGAEARGSRRHAVLARLVAARALLLAGMEPDGDLADDLAALDTLAGMEAWRVTAELAAAAGSDGWRRLAERRAEALAGRAGDHRDGLLAFARSTFDALDGRPG